VNDYLDPDHWINGGELHCPIEVRQRDEAVELLREILDGTCILDEWVSKAKKLVSEVAK